MKIEVPQTWYKEEARAFALGMIHSDCHIKRLQDRIRLMKAGTPDEHDIKHSTTLDQLVSYLEKAITPKEALDKYNQFLSKYSPNKDLKGDLKGAKKEILSLEDKIIKSVSIKDKFDPYHIIGVMINKYFLSSKQTDSLMNFMGKRDLLY